MIPRLLLLAVLGTISGCNPGTQTAEPPRAAPQAGPVLSEQKVRERSEQCAKTSQEVFSRDWKNVAATAGSEPAQGRASAEYVHHYNARLDTCFLVLTINGPGTLSRKLYDVNERELYGEYLGPAVDESPAQSTPAECRLAGLYCASGREWEVLVRNFMED